MSVDLIIPDESGARLIILQLMGQDCGLDTTEFFEDWKAELTNIFCCEGKGFFLIRFLTDNVTGKRTAFIDAVILKNFCDKNGASELRAMGSKYGCSFIEAKPLNMARERLYRKMGFEYCPENQTVIMGV